MRSQHYKQEQEKEQRKEEYRRKPKGKGGGRPNQFLYHWGVSRRLYGTLLQEGLLAAILALPIWGILALGDVKSITINTDFWTLWLILMMLFMVQSFMFRKGGG